LANPQEKSRTEDGICHDLRNRQFTLRGLLTITTIACLWLALMVSSVSGTGRLMVYLAPFFFALFLAHRFIMRADLPVTFVFAVWQPPGILFPSYVFVMGGLFWVVIGWRIAQVPYQTRRSSD
jgi:hypothetical protein